MERLLSRIWIQVYHHKTTILNLFFMALNWNAEGCGTAQKGGKRYLPLLTCRDKLLLRDGRSWRNLLLIYILSESGVRELIEDAVQVP